MILLNSLLRLQIDLGIPHADSRVKSLFSRYLVKNQESETSEYQKLITIQEILTIE